jgi:hypothetical protein
LLLTISTTIKYFLFYFSLTSFYFSLTSLWWVFFFKSFVHYRIKIHTFLCNFLQPLFIKKCFSVFVFIFFPVYSFWWALLFISISCRERKYTIFYATTKPYPKSYFWIGTYIKQTWQKFKFSRHFGHPMVSPESWKKVYFLCSFSYTPASKSTPKNYTFINWLLWCSLSLPTDSKTTFL